MLRSCSFGWRSCGSRYLSSKASVGSVPKNYLRALKEREEPKKGVNTSAGKIGWKGPKEPSKHEKKPESRRQSDPPAAIGGRNEPMSQSNNGGGGTAARSKPFVVQGILRGTESPQGNFETVG